MLTFFRRIRKGLLKVGSTSKYLLYTIGEIALVVIGILIALQINNWNEWRKDRVLEIIVLNDLIENLEINKKVLSNQIDLYHKHNRSFDIILTAIQNKQVYHDSLDYHFHKVQVNSYLFDVPQAGYEGLKNIGFEIIRNKSIQKEIINLFEVTYEEMKSNLAWGGDDRIWKAKYMDEQFYRPIENKGGTLKPFDYEYLLKDRYYYSLIHKYRAQRDFFSQQLDTALIQTNELVELIKENRL